MTTPSCPSWCVTDHSRYSFHASQDATVRTAGHRAFRVRVIRHDDPGDPRVQVEGAGILTVLSGDAGSLAALVEALAGATPEEHRRLGEAIRGAAQAAEPGALREDGADA